MKKQKLNLLFIFITIVLFSFTFNITSSRYIGQLESKVNDVNAIPVLNLINPTFTETIKNMVPGSVVETDFYISNHDDTNINEVLMKYYIKVQKGSEIPLKIQMELTLDNEGKTPEEELIYCIENQKKYHIKIEWNEKDNSYEYAGKNSKLNIEVIATQVIEGE